MLISRLSTSGLALPLPLQGSMWEQIFRGISSSLREWFPPLSPQSEAARVPGPGISRCPRAALTSASLLQPVLTSLEHQQCYPAYADGVMMDALKEPKDEKPALSALGETP